MDDEHDQQRDCEECGAPDAIVVMESNLPGLTDGPYLCLTCLEALGSWFTNAMEAVANPPGNAPTHAAKRREARKAQRKARKRSRRP